MWRKFLAVIQDGIGDSFSIIFRAGDFAGVLAVWSRKYGLPISGADRRDHHHNHLDVYDFF